MHNFLWKISVLFFRNPIIIYVANSKAFPRQRSNLIYSALSHSPRLPRLPHKIHSEHVRETQVCVSAYEQGYKLIFLLPAELLKIFMRLFTSGPVCWKHSVSSCSSL